MIGNLLGFLACLFAVWANYTTGSYKMALLMACFAGINMTLFFVNFYK
jgi:hypothetical protein